MPDFTQVRIFWYSGTGNSFIVAEKLAQTFADNGFSTSLVQIRQGLIPEISADELIGLVFPIAVGGTYPFVWEFFNRLPPAANRIFMVDTLGGYSGGIKGPLAKKLRAKGYHPAGALEIVMPENFPPGRQISEAGRARIKAGLELAAEFVNSLLSETATWTDIPVLSDLIGLACRFKSPWSFMRRIFSLRIDRDKCLKCGLCVKLCPIDNIKSTDSGVPVIEKACQSCMRCIAFCPASAIATRGGSRQNIKSCNVDELLAPARHFFSKN
jgi:Pyruvate/2-oxoacid:ferredoxin oxidoreductase delta subunit/flavodoxin